MVFTFVLQTNGRKVRVEGAVAALHLAAFCNQNEDGSCGLYKREAVAMDCAFEQCVCVSQECKCTGTTVACYSKTARLRTSGVLLRQWPVSPRLPSRLELG
jgi:hypothetical protein